MPWQHGILLGIVEGLTEFLPVSSTGHLILVNEWLGHGDEAAKSFEIVIQLGAVLAVVLYYRVRLAALMAGVLRRDAASVRLFAALAIAFLPAAIVGLAVHSAIEARLQMKGPVAIALVVGGFVMIGVERFRARTGAPADKGLEDVTPLRALVIGLAQCASLVPGMSRSMSTIVGGQLSGLSTATAAEFSFLLSIPTLGAATLFSLVKHRHALLAEEGGALALGVGLGVSFVVAIVVIAAFLRFLKRFGLTAFGYYRVVFGAIVLAVVLRDPSAWPR